MGNVAPRHRAQPVCRDAVCGRNDEVSFTVETDGRILTPSRELKVSNSVGEVTLRIEVDGSKATVTRNVSINKTIVTPAEWKSVRALFTALLPTAHTAS